MEQLINIKNYFKRTYILSDVYKIIKIIFKRIKIILRIIDIFLMYLSLNFYPAILYKFSTRKVLPQPNQKYKLNDKNFLPVKIIFKEKNTMKYFDEVNFVGYGDSFNIDNVKNFKNPTFLISFWATLRQKKDGSLVTHYTDLDDRYNPKFETLNSYSNDNIFYVVARKDICQDLIKNDCNIINVEGYREITSGDYILANNYNKPHHAATQQEEIDKFNNYKKKTTINIIENFRKPYQSHNEAMENFTPCGSFLPLILSLIPYCKKINIYGWDFYLKKNLANLNAFQIQKSLYNPERDWHGTMSWFHFECALINYYYAKLLSEKKNIEIHSYLGGIKKHKKFIKNIEKVLFF